MESMPISSLLTGRPPGMLGAGAPAAPTGEGKQLEESCNDFIGMLYAYVFSQMRGGGNEEPEEGTLFGGDHAQMLLGFMDQEMGRQLARNEGQGLAQQLLWQLSAAKHQQGKAP